jgi:hypothetical protein
MEAPQAPNEKADADLEAPEFNPATNAAASTGRSPLGGEVSEAPATAEHTPQPPRIPYTVMDLTGDNRDMLAEDDVIRSIEQLPFRTSSTRQILFPEIAEETVVEFEKQDDAAVEEEDDSNLAPVRRSLSKTPGLRDLTAQLMTANRAAQMLNSTKSPNPEDRTGMDVATRGTAADRMADTAAAMFSSVGELPAGGSVHGQSGQPGSTSSNASEGTRRKFRKQMEAIKHNRELFVDYISPRKKFIGHYWWFRFKYIIIPGLGVAALLFYAVGNPPHGILEKNDQGQFAYENGDLPKSDDTSVSWWLLFAVRQVITQSFCKWLSGSVQA